MDRDALLDQLRELNTLLNEHRALQVLLIIVLSLVVTGIRVSIPKREIAARNVDPD